MTALNRFLALALLAAAPTGAQPRDVRVEVLDSATRAPVARAQVRLSGVRGTVLTDTVGRALFTAVPEGAGTEVQVRRLGYLSLRQATDLTGEAPEVTLAMISAGVTVAAVDASAAERNRKLEESGFYDRLGHREGTLLTRAQIRASGTSRTIDLFRRIPGFAVDRTRDGRTVLVSVRGSGRRCTPVVFVDGTLVGARPGEAEHVLNLLPLSTVAGVEAYAGASSVPGIFRQTLSACGAVVIWTRLPDDGEDP